MEEVGRELTEYEKGFLEGLIDGEGCITIGRRTERCRCWLPVLSIGSCNKELLEKTKQIIGGGNIATLTRKTVTGKTCYLYNAHANVLRQILPQLKLIVKEEQRILMIEALNFLSENTPYNGYKNDFTLGVLASDIRNANTRDGKGKGVTT